MSAQPRALLSKREHSKAMTQPKTLAAVAVLTVGMVGCGGNEPSSPTEGQRALLSLSFTDPVVVAPGTDSLFAMEATVPMVITETTGVGFACISYFEFRVYDVATGLAVSPPPVVNFADPRHQENVQPLDVRCFGPGSRIEAPFRMRFSGIGTFRVEMTLVAWTGSPTSTFNALTRFYGEFRIVPTQ